MTVAASYWLPLDISEHGGDIDFLVSVVHYFMFALFIGWGIFFVYCLIHFRSRRGHVARYAEIKAKPSKYAEIAVVAVEAVLLIGLSMPVWAYYRNEPPTAEDEPLEVHVIAQQFAWNMHYPGPDGRFGPTRPNLVDEAQNPIGLDRDDPSAADDVVTLNNFYMPKDRDVLVRLSSKDVIHCFAVPLLRVKQDVIPGMSVPIWFKATSTNEDVRRELARVVELPASTDEVARFVAAHSADSAMADSGRAADGKPILAAGTYLRDESVRALMSAGVTELALAPANPVNIQCAQLCGLGHYRMMGQMQILEPAEFDNWYAKAGAEEEFLDEEEFEGE